MATTKIKCPVEGIIDLDRLPGVSAAQVEELIDAPELQRLRRIRQLGFSELVYPGATHTRFAHSLGAFQGSQRALNQLRTHSSDIDDSWFVATTFACLLHDLGHGPFSHTFERVSGQDHESRTLELVREGPRIPHVLEEITPGMVDRVCQLLRGEVTVPSLRFLEDLVSSALDCDRMDYLRRDAHHTGASYGDFDRDWLIREIEPTPSGDAVVVIEKGKTAAEQYLIGRYHMFQNVYLHKTSRGFEGAFRALCERILRMGEEALPQTSTAFRSLFDKPIPQEIFLALSDMSFLVEFESLVDHEDPTIRLLARALHFRQPLEQRTSWRDDDELAGLRHEREQTALAAGLDPSCSVFMDAAQDVPYRPYAPELARKGLRVRRYDGSLVDVTELSPTLKAISKSIVTRRLYWIDPVL